MDLSKAKNSGISICVVFGAGGHASVLLECLKEALPDQRFVLFDNDERRWGHELLGFPIVGGDDLLPELCRQGAKTFVNGVGSIGNTEVRTRVYERALSHNLVPISVVHPSALCARSATIGDGVQLLARFVINTQAKLGANVIVNTGAIVEHDCLLEDHVHVASGVTVLSNVHIGFGAHIGASATIRQVVTIGAQAVVGAGAVVVSDVPPGSVVVGVPARPIQASGKKSRS